MSAQHADGNEMRWWARFGLNPHVSAEGYQAEYEAEILAGSK